MQRVACACYLLATCQGPEAIDNGPEVGIGRAKIRRLDPADDVSNNKRLKFIFSVCTSDVFECIVRQLPVQQLW